MRVRWTADAADDLERICDSIAEERPEAARRVAENIVERIDTLKDFPYLGRIGRVRGTREIAFPPLPFLAIYESSKPGKKCASCASFMVRRNGHPNQRPSVRLD